MNIFFIENGLNLRDENNCSRITVYEIYFTWLCDEPFGPVS